MKNNIVKNTLYFSLFIQVFIFLICLIPSRVKLHNNELILQELLNLENFVQLIELLFYVWFAFFTIKNIDKLDIAKYRYYDWIITTPIMIFSTLVFFQYNNQNENNQNKNNQNENNQNKNKKIITLKNFVLENKNSLLKIFTLNFLMLLFGYLQEIGIINIFTSTSLGFLFFGLSFYYIYYDFAIKSNSNTIIYFLMLSLWSLYGVSAIFNNTIKNTLYNILDIFSKNFYGLFLAFLVYSLRIK